MSYKKLKKPWRGRKKGAVFKSNAPTERTVQDFLREGRTHDINSTITDLKQQGTTFVKELRKIETDRAKAESEATQLKEAAGAIESIVETLEKIRASGRTRIGNSELRNIIRSVMEERKLSPSAFGSIKV